MLLSCLGGMRIGPALGAYQHVWLAQDALPLLLAALHVNMPPCHLTGLTWLRPFTPPGAV